ncbi:chromosome segregation protein SMC [Legionella sainthelensi]|uniref:class I SAM-dependent methyltransferase n=1 Tax=Legionella sainthelensi TaxID=28087 RepID=UPI000F71FAB8|nr:class I SAM-dependent methyltransferase [Legionella sainthelensi]VEB38828.1 chromosome segregation protein SMC [Legionella sainthelensi]
MNPLLSNLGYSLDPNTRVWLKADCESIDYNDGDEVENRIAAVISKAQDVSLFSPELKKHFIDWPSLYHLNASRANILRPFQNILLGSDVLEIGSGCGAITRYLGECGANVLALEGTLRRAVITRARTRDLDNVEVVCEQFHKFVGHQKFDVITLIGVLEYADLFMPGECPVQSMLQQVKSMLKPEGCLIIAIENQLGLKYFAGAPEDHHGQPLYGIEGRYKGKQPTTYGRHTLNNHLHQAGFLENQFYAPFPDYKLPLSIIAQQGFTCQEFDAEMLITHGVRADPQLPPHLFFSPELVWPVVLKNKLGLDLANSFLIAAQTSKTKLLSSEVLAYHYSTHRAKAFCKETLFLNNKKGTIDVHCKLLETSTFSDLKDQELTHHLEERAVYIKGKLLSCDYIDIVTRDGWSVEEMSLFCKKYLSIVSSLTLQNDPIKEIDIDTLFPGNSIDLVPQNIIIAQNGVPCTIDQEWAWESPITAGFLIFRSILWLNSTISCYGKPESSFSNTLLGLFLALYDSMGYKINEEKIRSYYELEALFQRNVVQDSVAIPPLSSSLRMSNLNYVIADYKSHIQNLDTALTDKDNHIKNLEHLLEVKNNYVEALGHVIEDKDRHIGNIEHMFVEKENHIEVMERMVADKDKHIENIESILVEKGDYIGALEHVIADKDRHIGNIEYMLEEKGNHVVTLEHVIADKDRHIENIECMLEEKGNHVATLEYVIADKDKHIENIESILVEKGNYIGALEHVIAAKDRHIENIESMLFEKENHIEAMEHIVADKDKHIENIESILVEKGNYIGALEHVLEDKDRHIENIESILVEKENHIRTLEQGIEDKDRHIENIESILVEKENHIRTLEQGIEDKDRHIENIEYILNEKENNTETLKNLIADKDRHIRNLEVLFSSKNKKILFLEQTIKSLKNRKVHQLTRKIRKKILRNPIKICSRSVFFDENWYLDHYPDVKASGLNPVIHYVKYGAAEKRDPGPNFSTAFYLEENPEVERMRMNPLVHFEVHFS